MYPILFRLGPLTLYSFGAFMALAALTAAWVVKRELRRHGYSPELASSLVFAAALVVERHRGAGLEADRRRPRQSRREVERLPNRSALLDADEHAHGRRDEVDR